MVVSQLLSANLYYVYRADIAKSNIVHLPSTNCLLHLPLFPTLVIILCYA